MVFICKFNGFSYRCNDVVVVRERSSVLRMMFKWVVITIFVGLSDVASQEWHLDPGGFRYFFTPSALPTKEGAFTVSQKELFLTNFSYSINPHFSVQGGTMLPLWFIGENNLFFGMKGGGSVTTKIHISGGINSFFQSESSLGGFTFPFITLTYGDNYKNFSLNISQPFLGNVLVEGIESAPFILLSPSGYYRISEKFALLTENGLLIPNGFSSGDRNQNMEIIGSVLWRFVGKRMTADFGVLIAPVIGAPLPLLSFSYSW